MSLYLGKIKICGGSSGRSSEVVTAEGTLQDKSYIGDNFNGNAFYNMMIVTINDPSSINGDFILSFSVSRYDDSTSYTNKLLFKKIGDEYICQSEGITFGWSYGSSPMVAKCYSEIKDLSEDVIIYFTPEINNPIVYTPSEPTTLTITNESTFILNDGTKLKVRNGTLSNLGNAIQNQLINTSADVSNLSFLQQLSSVQVMYIPNQNFGSQANYGFITLNRVLAYNSSIIFVGLTMDRNADYYKVKLVFRPYIETTYTGEEYDESTGTWIADTSITFPNLKEIIMDGRTIIVGPSSTLTYTKLS